MNRIVPKPLLALLAIMLVTSAAAQRDDGVFDSAEHSFRVEQLVTGLKNPWGLAILPDGDMLVTERGGRLRRISDGRLLEQPVSGLAEVTPKGQGGLMGIALHPSFAENRLVYLSFAGEGKGGVGTEVMRGRLDGMQLRETEVIFRAEPKSGAGRHFGSRLVFDGEGYLFVSHGDRGKQDRAQDLDDHRGSLFRINDDGSVPADNPFVGRAGAREEIYAYGHRNIQGLALDPVTGRLWSHEHGPQGGDELNIERPGANYGWPVITYGVNYGIGTKIGEGTEKPGMEQPVHYWVPSIAPSGLAVYRGDAFPGWQGDLFVGSLKFGLLVRLSIEDDRVLLEERLLDNAYGRIRDVVAAPDGYLYLLTDADPGQLLRVVPDPG
jgi:glucose/arabinose dehydrogenase